MSEQSRRTITRRHFLVLSGSAIGIGALFACAPATPPQPAPATTAVSKTAPTIGAAVGTAAAQVAPAVKGPASAVKFASTSSGAVGLITHVMAERKIDAKHGIALDLALFDPAAAEKAVLLKQVDVGLFPILSTATANAQGQPITIFGPLLFNHFFGLTSTDRPYTSLADLKGKRIATLDPVSSAYQSTQLIAATQGMSFEKDFQVVTSPAPAVIAFLERGEVEGIIQFEPNISNLLTTGKYKVFMDSNEEWRKTTGQSMFSIGLAAHQPWIDANRDTARRIMEASLETANILATDSSVYEGSGAKVLGLEKTEAIKLASERMPKIYPREWNQALVDSAMSVLRRAVELKLIEKMPERQVLTVLS